MCVYTYVSIDMLMDILLFCSCFVVLGTQGPIMPDKSSAIQLYSKPMLF